MNGVFKKMLLSVLSLNLLLSAATVEASKNVAPSTAQQSVKTSPSDLAGVFKKGFTFQTEDKNSSISFHTRLQPRYSFFAPEGANNDVQSFLMRRVYFGIDGSLFTPNLTYNLTLTATPSGGSNAYYANMSYESSDLFQTTVGLQKIKFNRQEITSSGKQQFIDRSLANERYNLDRSIGALFFGHDENNTFEYYLSIFNGRATKANANNNADLQLGYAARAVWNVLGDYGYEEGDIKGRDEAALTVGLAGAYYNEEVAVSATEDRVYQGSFDLGYKYQGFSAQGEVFLRNTSPNGTSASQTDLGDYVQIGYFVVPHKFEIAGRVSMLYDDLNDDGLPVYFDNGSLTGLGGGNDAVDAGDAEEETEVSLALNYFVFEQNLKIQGQYTLFLDGQAGGDTTNHVGMIQATLQF